MKVLITLFCLAIAGLSNAQLSKPHYLYLYSGDSIEGTRLLYQTPILKPANFSMDGEIFETNLVQYLVNNNGYFANLNKIYGDKSERYALRIKAGKINLFEEIDMEYYGQDELQVDKNVDESMQEMLATGEIFQYYNLGTGELKKASYKNLKLDIGSNEASKQELNRYRKLQFLQYGLMAAGAGIITYDIIRQSGDAVRFSPWMAVGIAVGGSSYFLESKKEDAKWLAADAYNKN